MLCHYYETIKAEIAKMKREWKNEQKSFRDNLDLSMSVSMRDDLGSPGANSSRDLLEVHASTSYLEASESDGFVGVE